MQIDYLRYFIALYDHHSVTKASLFLNTTPQNVSRILRKIEAECNCVLFTHTPNGTTLTANGEEFLEFAKSTVYQYDELQARFELNKNTTSSMHTITLFSSNSINEVLLNEVLTTFSKKYPSIVVNNIIVDWKEGYRKLSETPEALGFFYYFPDENTLSDFSIVPTFSFQPVAIMNKNHPLAKKQWCTKKQLLNYKLLIFTKNDPLDTEIFHAFNLDSSALDKNILYSGNRNSCFQILENSDYVSVSTLNSFQLQEKSYRDHLITLPIIDQSLCTCALIKSKSLPLTSPQQLLFSFILNYLQQQKALT